MPKLSKKILIPVLSVFVLAGGGGAYYVMQTGKKSSGHQEASSASAHGATAEQSSLQFMLNRKPAPVPVTEEKEGIYISLTDLAPLLDGKLSASNRTYTLQLSKPVTFTEQEGVVKDKKFYIPVGNVSRFGGIYNKMGDALYVDYALKRVERIGDYQNGTISRTYDTRSAYDEAAAARLALPNELMLKQPVMVYYRYEELPKGEKRAHYGTYIPIQDQHNMLFLLSISVDAAYENGKWKTEYHAMKWHRTMGGEISPLDGAWSNLQFTSEMPQLPIKDIVEKMKKIDSTEEVTGKKKETTSGH